MKPTQRDDGPFDRIRRLLKPTMQQLKQREAFDIMNSAFMRMRAEHSDKSADELLAQITRPDSIGMRDWGYVFERFRPYARSLPALVKATVSPARDTDPDTSQIAAIINTSLRSKQRVEVLIALYSAGTAGATDFELSETCKLLRTSAGKRRKELCDVALAAITEERRTTDTDSPAVVWCITRLGRKVVETMQAIQH